MGNSNERGTEDDDLRTEIFGGRRMDDYVKGKETEKAYTMDGGVKGKETGKWYTMMGYVKGKETEIASTDIDRYRKKPGQTGLVLIVNFMFSGTESERRGSNVDVTNLTDFFEKKLGYQVNCPAEDMTKKDLHDYLKHIESKYLTERSIDYHSFICIVMSHGNESGIETKDEEVTVKEITNVFKNKSNGKFNGKPKIFLIQTCRGNQQQEKFVVSDSMRAGGQSSSSEYCYFSDAPASSSGHALRLPLDADIIVAYGTTPGYIAIRNEIKGSFFIRAFLSIAKEHYKDTDIEDILRKVRKELARNPEYEITEGRLAGKCQMGQIESTSTMKFFL